MDALLGLSRKKYTGVIFCPRMNFFEGLDEFVMTTKCEFYRVMQ